MTKRCSDGFTLIELLVVIAIISLLSSIVLASLNSARSKAKDASAKSQAKAIQSQAALYYSDNNTYVGMWNAGTNVNAMYLQLVAIEDNTLFRGSASIADYYYAGIQLKNTNVLCIDGAGVIKEVPVGSFAWPTGNYVCP